MMAKSVRMYQVDAFTSKLFGGNPAAVCVLEDAFLPADTMLAIAAENNLAETAYVCLKEREDGSLPLKWFTPDIEMDLCGHATLATAHVVFRY
jgi:PhzF family phenazine biosynthesis protein